MNKLLTTLLATTFIVTSYAHAEPAKKHQKRVDRIEQKWENKYNYFGNKRLEIGNKKKSEKHERVFTDLSGSDGPQYPNGERNPHVELDRIQGKGDHRNENDHLIMRHTVDEELTEEHKRGTSALQGKLDRNDKNANNNTIKYWNTVEKKVNHQQAYERRLERENQ